MTTIQWLLALMNIPARGRVQFDGVVHTMDGYYLLKARGDVGYNHFLGRPAPPHDGPGRTATLATWARMTREEQRAVYALAARPGNGYPIDLHAEFGVPLCEEVSNE